MRTRVGAASVVAVLLAMAVVMSTVPVAAADPAANGVPLGAASHLAGDARGIVTLLEDEGLVRYQAAFVRLDRGATYRVVLGATKCGAANDTLQRLDRFTSSRRSMRTRSIDGLTHDELLAARSIRLVRLEPAWAQVACGAVTAREQLLAEADPTGVGPASFDYTLSDILVTSFTVGETRGIVEVKAIDGDTVKLSFVAWITVGLRHRIVGSTVGCEVPLEQGGIAFDRAVDLPGARFDVTVTANSTLGLDSIRTYRGSGFGHPTGCSNIIGVLIAL